MVPGVKVHWMGESSGSPDRTVAPLRPVTLYCQVEQVTVPGSQRGSASKEEPSDENKENNDDNSSGGEERARKRLVRTRKSSCLTGYRGFGPEAKGEKKQRHATKTKDSQPRATTQTVQTQKKGVTLM